MKKYLEFFKVNLRDLMKGKGSILTTVISFTIHIIVFSFLWDFVLEGKTLAGYSKNELIWYVIIAEAIMYSSYMYYKKIAYKVEMGDFAYDMTKPYNFLGRAISEGLSEIPLTLTLVGTGVILGFILAGPINISLFGAIFTILLIVISITEMLVIHILVGLTSIWLGRDVSSVWLLCQKAMLIFAFSPIELFSKKMQVLLKLLPTTHIIYSPAATLVHNSTDMIIKASLWQLYSITILLIVMIIIYKKGVRKQNVNGI